MLVEDIMTTDLVTCAHDAALQTAVVRLVENRVGSVILLRDGDPTGIVTETDALRAGAVTERPFVEIAARDAASSPLVTTPADASVRKAVGRMRDHGIKKLPVVDGVELTGIVTHSDVAVHYNDFVREIHDMDRQRERWEARKADVDEF
jgi:CBS domain-containing protein